MVRVTPKTGAVFLREDSSGFPAGIGRLPSVVGALGGAAPSGVALKLDSASDEFRLVLLDRDNAALMSFGPYPEEEAVAEWRGLAAASGLTLKLQLPNGAVMTPFPQLGSVLIGPVRIRRRHGLLSGRRPRFLTRRKTGRFPLRPQVHREAEMAGGGDR
jgi:hypothetical protein